jgi:hypothetical protein
MTDEALLPTCVELTTLRLLRGPSDADGSAAAIADHVAGCARCQAAAPAVDAALAELAGPPPIPSTSEAEERLLARLAAPTQTCAACAGEVARTRDRSCPACLAPHHLDCAASRSRCTRCQARLAPRRRPSLLPLLAGGVGGLVVAAAAWSTAHLASRPAAEGAQASLHLAEPDHLRVERLVVLGRAALAQGDPRAAHALAGEVLRDLPAEYTSRGGVVLVDPELRRVRAEALALRVRATLTQDPSEDAIAELAVDVQDALRHGGPRAALAAGELEAARRQLDAAHGHFADASGLPEHDPELAAARAGWLRAGVALERWPDVITAASAAAAHEPLEVEARAARAVAHAALAAGAAQDPTAAHPHEVEAEADGLEAARLGRARRDWRGALGLADARFRLGERWAGRDALKEARDLGALDPAVDVARAEVLLAAGALPEALEAADAALAQAPTDAAARALRAEVLLEQLDVRHALEDAVPVSRGGASPQARARALRVRAAVAHLQGDAREARNLGRAAEELDPSSIPGQLLLVQLELDGAHEDLYLDSAERRLRAVLRVRPRSIEVQRGLIRMQLARHGTRTEAAERRIDELLTLDPRDPLANFARAQMCAARGQADAARSHVLTATRAARDPRRPEGRAFALGVLAERLAQAAPRVGPETPGFTMDLMLPLGRVGQLSEAVRDEEAGEAFAAALAADPLHVQALVADGLRALRGDAASAKRAGARWVAATASLELLGPVESWLSGAQVGAPPAFVVAAAELCARGETEGPRLLHLDLTALRTARVARVDLSSDWVVAANELDRLRKRSPWDVTSFVLEAAALRHALGTELDAALAQRLQARLAALEVERRARVEERDRRAAADDPDRPPLERVRAAPWLAAPWAALAQERAGRGEAWSALAAHVRAAWLDPGRSAGLGASLEAASQAGPGPDDFPGSDRELAVADPALAELLRGARFVAEGLARPPEPVPQARASVEALEELALADPRATAPQLLLGCLYLAVGQRERALEHLLFVAAAARSGEACLLAAAAVSADEGATDADLERAVEWLHTAAALDAPVAARVATDPRFERLRRSPLAARLPKG